MRSEKGEGWAGRTADPLTRHELDCRKVGTRRAQRGWEPRYFAKNLDRELRPSALSLDSLPRRGGTRSSTERRIEPPRRECGATLRGRSLVAPSGRYTKTDDGANRLATIESSKLPRSFEQAQSASVRRPHPFGLCTVIRHENHTKQHEKRE